MLCWAWRKSDLLLPNTFPPACLLQTAPILSLDGHSVEAGATAMAIPTSVVTW